MEHLPFTYDEATDICVDFDDLVKTKLKIDHGVFFRIEAVLITPFTETDKRVFIASYERTKNQQAALSSYSGQDFEVVVCAYNSNEEQYLYINIRDFIDHKGINYNFPGH